LDVWRRDVPGLDLDGHAHPYSFACASFITEILFGKRIADPNKKEQPEIATPLDIIKNSYARGEISREEFLQKRDDLLEK